MIQPESRIPPTRRKSVLPFEVIEDPAPPNTTNEAAPSELEPRLPEGPQAVEPPPE